MIADLDMYLYARKYFGGYDFSTDKEVYKNIVETSGLENMVSKESPSVCVSATVAYWRNANAIHGWIVGLSGEEDNCQEIPISREQLGELRDACKFVLLDNSLANEMLPPTVGFFLGSDEVDEWYLKDLEYTAKELDKLLRDADESLEFMYQASL